jgi:hypothetical protein
MNPFNPSWGKMPDNMPGCSLQGTIFIENCYLEGTNLVSLHLKIAFGFNGYITKNIPTSY